MKHWLFAVTHCMCLTVGHCSADHAQSEHFRENNRGQPLYIAGVSWHRLCFDDSFLCCDWRVVQWLSSTPDFRLDGRCTDKFLQVCVVVTHSMFMVGLGSAASLSSCCWIAEATKHYRSQNECSKSVRRRARPQNTLYACLQCNNPQDNFGKGLCLTLLPSVVYFEVKMDRRGRVMWHP